MLMMGMGKQYTSKYVLYWFIPPHRNKVPNIFGRNYTHQKMSTIQNRKYALTLRCHSKQTKVYLNTLKDPMRYIDPITISKLSFPSFLSILILCLDEVLSSNVLYVCLKFCLGDIREYIFYRKLKSRGVPLKATTARIS